MPSIALIRPVACALTIVLALPAAFAAADETEDLIEWQDWSGDLFDRARRENRFVLLDLEAVWCHWCHVMDRITYHDPEVAELINSHYIPVRVDQDAHPALSHRYGDWGWPATIVFAPDSTEIVRRRGYLPPVVMVSMLQAIIDDPSPGPSVFPDPEVTSADHPGLTQAQRNDQQRRYFEFYDAEHGGWGELHKFIDDQAMAYALAQARRDCDRCIHMAHRTLQAAQHLIDPVWGGVYQYSDQLDWRSPHYEKIMSHQAGYLRHYALAHALWGEPEYLKTANAIYRYLTGFLMSPDGAFYTSQNADLNARIDGHTYYRLNNEARRKLGIPAIDTHIYARENGWAIRALVALHDFTGNDEALEQAGNAARYIIAHRGLDGGGFSHGENDPAGPYLGDTLAMGRAFLSLHRATGEREWLKRAERALDFIAGHFTDTERGGYITAPVEKDAVGVFSEPVKLLEENVGVARFANLLYHYTGESRHRESAGHAMRYLAAPAILNSRPFLPGVLLTDDEWSRAPVHITVVGHKDDPAARKLHAAALEYPAVYKRVEWWDKREGPLPNPDVTYPELERPAAFACANRACSLPVFEPDQIAAAVDRLQALQIGAR